MKLSNNAITFLMAQYRAIYKNAYLKGLVGAALVSLSVGVASASAAPISGAENWEGIDSLDPATAEVTENETIVGDNKYFNNIDITSGSLEVETAGIFNKGKISVASGAALEINGVVVQGFDSDSANAVGTVESSGNITITGSEGGTAKSGILAKKVTLSGGEVTLTGGTTAPADWKNQSQISVYGKGIEDGGLHINSDTELTIDNYSHIASYNGLININDSTVNFTNTATDDYSFILGTGLVQGSNLDNNVFMQNATINKSGAGTAGIFAKNTIINSSEINVTAGTFILDGEFVEAQKGGSTSTKAQAATKGIGYFNFTESTLTVNEGATFTVGGGTTASKQGMYDITTFNLQSGSKIENSGTVNVSGSLYLSSGTSINNSGTIAITASEGAKNIKSIGITANDATITNSNAININANGVLALNSGSTLENKGTIKVGDTGQANAQLTISSSTFNNAAEKTLTVASGSVSVNSGATFNNNGTVTVSGASNASDASVTLNQGSIFNNNSKLDIKKGSFVINSGSTFNNSDTIAISTDGTLKLDVANLDVESVINDSQGSYYSLNLDKLGEFTNSGTIAFFTKDNGTAFPQLPEGENVAVQINDFSDLHLKGTGTGKTGKVELSNVGLSLTTTSEVTVNSDILGSITGPSAGQPEVFASNFKVEVPAEGFASPFPNIKLVSDYLKFNLAAGKKDGEVTVTVNSGSYVTNKTLDAFDANGTQATILKFTGGSLELGNYSPELDNENQGQVKVDTLSFEGGNLDVSDRVWNAKNVTIGAAGSSLSIEKGTGDGTLNVSGTLTNSGNIKVGYSDQDGDKDSGKLSATKYVQNGGSFTAEYDSTVGFGSVNITAGTFTASNTNLTISGDGSLDSVDISGASNINLTAGTLNLGQVKDTIGAKVDGNNGLTFADGAVGFKTSGTTINIDLTGVAESISIAEANTLFGKLTGQNSTGLVNITGNVAPALPQAGADGTVSFDDLKGKGQTDVNLNFSTDQSKKTVVSGVNGSIAGGWQALQTSSAGADQSVSVKNGTLSLHGTNKNSNNIVQSSDGKVAGVSLGDNTNLIVESTGNIGAITGDNASLVIGQNAEINVVKDDSSAADVKVANVTSQGKLNVGNLTVEDFTANSGSVITSSTLKVNGSLNANGAEFTTNEANLSGEATIAGGSLNVQAVAGSASGKLTAATLIVNSGAVVNAKSATVENLTINGGANLVAETLELKNSGEIRVGAEKRGDIAGSSANVSVKALQLGKGTLIVDPDFGQQTATVFTSSFKDVPAAKGARGVSANNTLEGRIIVGKNSAFGFGTDKQAFRSTLAKYQDGGSLSAKGVGAYVYLDQPIKLAANASLTVGTQDIATLEEKASGGNAIYLDSGAAIQVTANALNQFEKKETGTGYTGAVISSDSGNANLESKKDATVFVPTYFQAEDMQRLFKGFKFDETDDNNELRVATENGVYYYTITKNYELDGSGLTRQADPTKKKALYSNISTAVAQFNDAVDVAHKEGKVYKSFEDFDKAVTPPATSASEKAPANSAYASNGVAIVQDGAGASFFAEALGSTDVYTIQNVDRASRLAAFGASVQVANSASQSTIDAISGRLGMGNSANKLTVADNADGAAMWVTPIYRNSDVDSFSAQNLNYGSEFDFFGAALGFDYSIGGHIRVGGALNFGSGDADGKGTASGVKNDFSYFGGAIYAGFNPMPALALTADITYTVVDNDLEFESGMKDYGKVSGSTDSSALSFGVNAQYTFKGASLDVAPHIGARYTRLDVDGFDFKSAKKGYLGSNDSDALSYFSIPLGVSVSKDFVSDNWTIRPAVDFTVTLNAGDDELDGKTYFEGIEGVDVISKTEVLDSFTYGATAGVAGSNGAFSFGINVGYTGSSEVTEYGISANARFVF